MESLVAVYDIAVCIGEDNAVGIPIQRDAHVRMVFADKTAHLFGVRGSAVFVDIGSVRRGGDCNDFDAEFLEDQRSDIVGGSVGAVENGSASAKRTRIAKRSISELPYFTHLVASPAYTAS